ncbi:MAG TPA: DoxX family membrane protein [Deltaproteobacteria bacterium]|nr:DoxX family membrane protein [Deltaproteobacteria bacterium]HIJ40397.1 DoxX family membrane protein [Deltaproteobacteria bacterium]
MSGCRTQQNSYLNGISSTGDFRGFTDSANVTPFTFSIWIYRVIRISLAGIFLWSGASKLFAPESFAVIIEAYGLIPDSWITLTSVLLPALEVILAMGMIFDVRGSLTGIAGLLVLFMAILAYGILMGLDVDCGCFGPEDPEATAFHGLRSAFYRDMGVMAGIGYLYVWRGIQRKRPVGLSHVFKFYSKRREEK